METTLSSCSRCSESIKSPLPFWTMNGCCHSLCSECFTEFAINVKKKCPCCKSVPPSITHTYFKLNQDGQFCQESSTSSIIHSGNEDLLTISTKDRKPLTITLDPSNQEEDRETLRKKIGLILKR